MFFTFYSLTYHCRLWISKNRFILMLLLFSPLFFTFLKILSSFFCSDLTLGWIFFNKKLVFVENYGLSSIKSASILANASSLTMLINLPISDYIQHFALFFLWTLNQIIFNLFICTHNIVETGIFKLFFE